jgi:hypothetical protein
MIDMNEFILSFNCLNNGLLWALNGEELTTLATHFCG